jgi:flavin reductase (DIM6/NTAB) family NADH-FMN oxidoreductase RutF
MMKNKRKHLSPGALLAPVPPALVTAGKFDEANIITIGWTGILATQPPKTYISVRPTRYSYELLRKHNEFVINLPSVDLARKVDYAGIYTGKKVDKWVKCGFTKQKSERVDTPTIAECPIALECRVTDIIPMGSHDVFMADIVGVSCQESILDEEGKMRFDRADLLAYAHGEYYALGDVVGRFGFSTDKGEKGEKTKKNVIKTPKNTDKKPFYENAPRGKSIKKKPTDKNKGAPHGKRGAAKK